MLRSRLLILTLVGFALTAADARAAVPPDALPDAAAPFTTTFATERADGGRVGVVAITVDGLAAGQTVGFTCRGCLGQTAVEAVATGSRQVFRPKLRITRASRLEVRVQARNFGRTQEFQLAGERLHVQRRSCTSVAENRVVSCRTVRAARPWATMNVCTPDRVGIRAASSGGGSARQTVAARFRLQYADAAGRWADVPNGASPWMTLGAANRSFQGGYTFQFTGLKGRTFRGVADFEWRRDGRVERHAARFTSPGRRVSSGRSSSVCVL